MSADFNTTIRFKGRKEDYLHIKDILRYYCEERYQQYTEAHNCWYLELVMAEPYRSDQDKVRFLLSGPYGVWNGPISDEIDLFERIAETAPNCWFKGKINGWDAGADQSITAELNDGKLYLKSSYKAFGEDSDIDDYDEDYDEEGDTTWERVYDPVAKTYEAFAMASNGDSGDSVTISIKVTDRAGEQYELVLESESIEDPLNLACFPRSLIYNDDVGEIFRQLANDVEGVGKKEAKEKIAMFGKMLTWRTLDRKVEKLELTKVHDHKAPFFFNWLRYNRDEFGELELRSLAKRVTSRATKQNLRNFEECLDAMVISFPDCEWTGWPDFCKFGKSYIYSTRDDLENKAVFDWHGIADDLEELANYICSKKNPREYAVEQVIIDYAAKTIKQTAVYMPRDSKEDKTIHNERAVTDTEWIKDKIFVLTGFDNREEKAITQVILDHSGEVKSSTVLKTNYLVYNPDYSAGETTKLKRAKELIERGKPIELISGPQFWEKIGS